LKNISKSIKYVIFFKFKNL